MEKTKLKKDLVFNYKIDELEKLIREYIQYPLVENEKTDTLWQKIKNKLDIICNEYNLNYENLINFDNPYICGFKLLFESELIMIIIADLCEKSVQSIFYE